MACTKFAIALCQQKSKAGPGSSSNVLGCLGFLLHHAEVDDTLYRLLQTRLNEKKDPFVDEDDCSKEAKGYLEVCNGSLTCLDGHRTH